MRNKNIHQILTYLIVLIWLINGLFCKVLNWVPRHQEIVGKILNLQHEQARLITLLIGISEVIMAVWVLSKFQQRLNAIIQMSIIATMNILEFVLVPDLLLWGRLNSLFAFLLILIIYYNEFNLKHTKSYV